jgi:hypothetical protein
MRRAFWIWNIPNCEKGDPLAIAAVAHRAGLTDVFVKVADGPVKFGVYAGRDVVPPVVQALKAVGIRVWGWQYVYGNNPAGEELIASARIKELGLDGYIVDAEVEFKKAGWGARAETYLSRLKANNPNVTIAFSSYRWPHYHPEFPWAVFYKYCDINMPQVYWLQAHNAAYQTALTFQEFQAMGTMPIWPAGPAWKENGWAPTLDEIRQFEASSLKNGAELVSYWSWEHCRRDLPGLWPADVVTPPTPPTPPAPAEDTRLAQLELKIADLEKALADLSKVLSDLKAILK